MTDIPRLRQTTDKYTFLPLVLLLPVSLLGTVLLIFEPGGLLGSGQFWLAFFLLLLSTAVWLVTLLISVFAAARHARWRRLLSILIAGFVSIGALVLCIRFEDQIRFQIMRPFYLRQIARSQETKMTWPWRGGLGWDETLFFDRSPEGHAEDSEREADGCVVSTRRFDEHFYLQDMNCTLRK
jgi:hypothetical protein